MFEHIASWLEGLTIVVLGIFSFLTLLERRNKTKQNDIITNFEKTIESMQGRLNEMQIEIDDQAKEITKRKEEHQESLQKIATLTGENNTLKLLLTDRDPASEKYRAQSIELLHGLITEMKNISTNLNDHANFVKMAHPEVAKMLVH